MQSEFTLTPQIYAIVKYERCIEAYHFIRLDVAMSFTIFKMHDGILFVL